MARRAFPLVIVLLVLALTQFAPSQPPPKIELIAPSDPRTPAEEKKCFHLPPGFDVELVAAEPDIAKPLNIAFDARGRLWVSDTLEYPYAAEPGKKARDSVKILDDFGPDGRARKITTFADGLNIPTGLLPLEQSALIYSIPAIYRMSDTDGDGKADQRKLLYEKYGHVDTHGMTSAFTWSFDGWVYACHGYRNDSVVKASDGSTVKMNSGNVYRFKLDGSHVEQVTWGQVNPFGLSLDPLGNLYSADCHSMPIYQLLRGAYYPSFGKPHDGLGEGPKMMDHEHHSTGIAGITFYAAEHFPKEWQGNIFIGNVVTSRVNLDRLEWRGSSPWAVEKPDFVRSDDLWFRPVDIKLGPDGALYIADFYNKIIGHYEVDLRHPGRDRHRGRIWRIVYRGPDGKGKAQAPRADWTRANIAELIDDLGHSNLTVRMLAMHQLTQRSADETSKAVKAIMKPETKPTQRAHGVWVLERLASLDDATLHNAVEDKEAIVRVHACRVLSERAKLSEMEHELLLKRLKDTDPNVHRAAADALGRHPESRNIRPLLDVLHLVPSADTHLRHVVRIALRDQVRASKPGSLPEGNARDAAALADVTLAVPTRQAAQSLVAFVEKNKPLGEPLLRMAGHIARYGKEQETSAIVQHVLAHLARDPGQQAGVFMALAQGASQGGSQLGADSLRVASTLVNTLLDAKDGGSIERGINLAGSLRLSGREDDIARIFSNDRSPLEQRIAAVNALAAIDGPRHVELFGKVLAHSSFLRLRQETATALVRMNRPEGRAQLLSALQTAPAVVQTIIAEGLASTAEGGEALLAAVGMGKASARLLQERGVEGRLKNAKIKNLDQRVARLTAGLPSPDAKILDLMRQRHDGFRKSRADAQLGLKVFEKNCANCHQIGGKGAKIGPQLDGIGIRGLDRLLEDTLDPNRNVDQAFRTTILNTKKGQLVSGLLLREEGEVLVLADNMGKEVRVAKNEIEDRSVSPLSPMPANLADQISETDFHHLMAYLLSQRVSGK
jgi:putative heme-binding domain-containing protein